MLDPTPKEEFFSRIGATHKLAEELADEFDSVAEFLETPFEDKLRVVVGTRAAQKIAAEYEDFEYMRDVGSCRAFRSLEGVGGKSAMRVDYSYIRRTISTPRDVLTVKEVAEKMGFVTERPQPAQAELGNWHDEIRADGGRSVHTGGRDE